MKIWEQKKKKTKFTLKEAFTLSYTILQILELNSSPKWEYTIFFLSKFDFNFKH